VYDTLKDAVDDKVDPSILLSHKILWQKVKRLLKCHLQQKYRLLIELLRPKTIQYQLSLMRMHITYFHTTPDELTLLLTPLAYDACWVCNRLHFPVDCANSHLQAKLKPHVQVKILHFQIPQKKTETYDLQLQSFRSNRWEQLHEYSKKHNTTIETLLQDQNFFKRHYYFPAK